MPAPTRHDLQVGRIARLLGVAPSEVRGLDEVPVDDLRELHTQITQALFGDAQDGFRKVAGLSALIPSPLAGRLAELFVPPVIAARVTEVLDPARARDLVGRLRISYLADVAVELDPARAAPVLVEVPPARIGEIAAVLFARGEHAVMAEFVNVVPAEALEAAMTVAKPHDLLALVPLLEWNPALDTVVADLSDDQVRAIVDDLDATELAELAVVLGPGRLEAVVALLDVDVVVEISRVLLQQEEYDVLGGFAVVVGPEVVELALATTSADERAAITPYLP